MKIRRQKTARRVLSHYRTRHAYRPPYRVLVDGTFCAAALRAKVQIGQQLPGYLGGEVELCTTGCVLHEMETLGKEVWGARLIAQRFKICPCGHFDSGGGGGHGQGGRGGRRRGGGGGESGGGGVGGGGEGGGGEGDGGSGPVPPLRCLLSLLQNGNPNKYFIATQDPALTIRSRRLDPAPLIYIVQNTMVLEKPRWLSCPPPSSTTSTSSTSPSLSAPLAEGVSPEHPEREKAVVEGVRRKRRRGGPNPLSCLKKKKKIGADGSGGGGDGVGRRRKRRRRSVRPGGEM